jgi:hypothetical protein
MAATGTSDREQICDLVGRFGHATDLGTVDYMACYADDGVMEIEGAESVVGHEALRSALSKTCAPSRRTGPARGPATCSPTGRSTLTATPPRHRATAASSCPRRTAHYSVSRANAGSRGVIPAATTSDDGGSLPLPWPVPVRRGYRLRLQVLGNTFRAVGATKARVRVAAERIGVTGRERVIDRDGACPDSARDFHMGLLLPPCRCLPARPRSARRLRRGPAGPGCTGPPGNAGTRCSRNDSLAASAWTNH